MTNSTNSLGVDADGYRKVADDVMNIRRDIAHGTTNFDRGYGQDAYGSSEVSTAVAHFLSAWNSENNVALSALDETARKMRMSLVRYEESDARGGSDIRNAQEHDVTVEKAGTLPTGTPYNGADA